jgi:hypothetical protein
VAEHQQEARLQEVLDAISDCLKSDDRITARVADALLAYAGPPSENGVNNHSERELRHVASEVKKKFEGKAGRFSSVDYLRQLRRTAFNFPAGERSPGVPFSWMIVACDPETLRNAIADAKRKCLRCSANRIRTYRKHIEDKRHINDKTIDHDHASALVLLQQVETQLVENHRYFCKFPQRCTKECKKWSDDQRQALATAADNLITALVEFKAVIQPAKGVTLEAAE